MAVRAVSSHLVGLPAENGEAPPTEADIEVLGTLVLDRVAQHIALREQLADRVREVGLLTVELDEWRARALREAAMGRVEAAASWRRERELVSTIHRQMVHIDTLTVELERLRLPWWRRIGRSAT
jgi:hypothetical protein